MIPFVSPCCHRPLPIKSLDEIVVGLYRAKDPDDLYDSDSYGIIHQCCGSLYDSLEKIPANAAEKYRQSVFKASVDHAWRQLEAQYKQMKETLAHQVEDFADAHDPSLERVFAFAIYGSDANGFGIANYQTGDRETFEEALEELEAKATWLCKQSYVETDNDKPLNMGMKVQRKFIRGHEVRYVGCWTQPIRTGDGFGSSECEGAYLSTY